MRVCFLTTSYPRFPGDVAGVFIARLAQSLHDRGITVQVVAPNDGGCARKEVVGGIIVHRFNYFLRRQQRVAYGFGGVPANLARNPLLLFQVPFFFFFFLLRAWSVIRECDLLHVHWVQNLVVGWPAARLLRKPCIVTLWGSDLEWLEEKGWLFSLMRPLLVSADRVVCLTQGAQKWLESCRIAQGRARVIANGVDTDIFCPRDKVTLRRELGLPPEALILLYVGSLIPRKGLEVLVEAIHLMRSDTAQFLVILIGEGEKRLPLEERVRHLGLSQNIRFLGSMPSNRIPLWMVASDLFVLPSFHEGRPNVLLEAMSSGLPVIATDIPGNRDLVTVGENALLVPPGDPAALAVALNKLIADRELRAQMGRGARLSIQEMGLTWEECASKHIRLYRELAVRGAT
ncbi:MAG: glycosyltransferase family 4 protein [Candidatus Binatia bacterium]